MEREVVDIRYVYLALICFSAIASMTAVAFVAYLVRQLHVTDGGLRVFRVLFPPRRQRTVPWGVSAIPFVLVISLLMPLLAYSLVQGLQTSGFGLREDVTNANAEVRSLETETQDELSEQHPLTILMQKSGRNTIVILVCFLTAVIVAPLAEEFLFRVVIQGGIEATLRREYGNSALAKRLPILITSLFFAAIHFRFKQEIDQSSIDVMFQRMAATMIGNTATVIVVIVIFRFFHIRWSDVGLWDFRRIGRDALGAFLLQLAIFIPIGAVNFTVQTLAKTQWATTHGISSSMGDPIPLFLFAMLLGTLYSRTRRFASVFFLHAFFNLYGFLILLYLSFAAI